MKDHFGVDALIELGLWYPHTVCPTLVVNHKAIVGTVEDMAATDSDLWIYLTVAICGAFKYLDICRTLNRRSALLADTGAATLVKRCVADRRNGLAADGGGLFAEERHVWNSVLG